MFRIICVGSLTDAVKLITKLASCTGAVPRLYHCFRDGKLQRSVCFAQDMTSGIPDLQTPPDLSPSIDCPKIVCCLPHLVSLIPEVHCELLHGLTPESGDMG